MAVRVYNRTSAGRRNSSVNLYSEVTKSTPEKTLLEVKKKNGGRNHHGKITVQSRGGGHKQRYRQVDFRRNTKLDMAAKVIGIEYDPNRTSNIALLEFEDGEKRYVVAPIGLTDGDEITNFSGRGEPKTGNSMLAKYVPTGLSIHNIELTPGRGGAICRSAGSYARLTNREGEWATIVLPSGEIRQISINCRVTIGQIGNTDHMNVRIGKAGRNRHKGKRPHTRGVAKNHCDHPLGGGDGKSKGGRAPASKTGVLAKGGKTRKRVKPSNKRILRRRVSKRYGQLTL